MGDGMKEYDIIAFGTGSSMNIVSPLLRDPNLKVAVIENEKAGGYMSHEGLHTEQDADLSCGNNAYNTSCQGILYRCKGKARC